MLNYASLSLSSSPTPLSPAVLANSEDSDRLKKYKKYVTDVAASVNYRGALRGSQYVIFEGIAGDEVLRVDYTAKEMRNLAFLFTSSRTFQGICALVKEAHNHPPDCGGVQSPDDYTRDGRMDLA